MKNSNIIKIAVISAGIITIGAILLFAYYYFTGKGGGGSYGKGKSKDELFREYGYYSAAGDSFKAYRAIKILSDREPENIPLAYQAAEAAIDAGKKAAANSLLQKVWDSGYRDPKVLFSLVSTSILPKYEQRKKAQELIAQISEESLRKKLYALYYFQMEQYENAESYFSWLIDNDPHQVVYEYAARNYLFLRRVESAENILRQALDNGYLGVGGEIILANILAVQGLMPEEEELYETFTRLYGYSDYVMLSHAIILMADKEFEQARQILEMIDNPYRFSAQDIISADEIIKEFNNNAELKDFRDKLSAKTRKVIDSDNIDIFEKALFLDYLANDFNRIAGERVTSETTFAQEAEKIYNRFDSFLKRPGNNNVTHQARINLAYIYFNYKDKDSILKLLNFADGDVRLFEGERELYSYYLDALDNRKTAVEHLEKAKSILGRNVIVVLSEAEYMSRIGDYQNAIKLYSTAAKINRTLGSGVYLLENLAKALADDGKYLASFELIRMMHEKRLITRETLILLRDVAYPAGFPEISAGAQKVLEKKFGKSDDILIGGGELKLKKGDAQSALEVFEKLLAKGVEPTYEARLNNAVAESMLQLKMFEDVLEIVGNKKVAGAYKGRALYGMGKYDQAIDVFRNLDQEVSEAGQWRVEYGLLLALKGREEEAAEQFKKAIAENPELLRAYVELASLLLKHKQFSPAREYALAALELSDSLIRAKLIVANVDIVQGRDASATVILRDILRSYPGNIDAMFLLSRSLLNQNEIREALEVIDRCLVINPQQPLLLQQKMDILLAEQNFSAALKVCEEAIKNGKDLAAFEHAQIMLLLELKQYDRAGAELKKSENIKGVNKLLLESQILEATGKYAEAFKLLQPYLGVPKIAFRMIELDIKDNNSTAQQLDYIIDNLDKFKLNAQALLLLGAMAEQQGKDLFAQKLYRYALQTAPDLLPLLNNYIWVSITTGKYDKEELLEKCAHALKLYPENTQILDTCALVYNKLRMYENAREILRRDPVLMRLDPRLYLRIGEAYEGLGQYNIAEDNFYAAKEARRSTAEIISEADKAIARVEKLKH